MSDTHEPQPLSVEFTLYDFFEVLWRSKWIIALVMLVTLSLAVVYSLSATKWYRSYAVVMHADQGEGGGLTRQLGGLAALANVGGFGAENPGEEALSVLRSRKFAAEFIRANNLLPVFAGFGNDPNELDAAGNDFDMREAVKFFHENVLRISEDSNTGEITLSVIWIDGEEATTWAKRLVETINNRMREQALEEAESNIAFLKGEMASNTNLPLQQSIGNLLENELQSLMLARGNNDFAFRVIDPPQIPLNRVRPRRALIVGSAGVVGGVFAVFLALIVNSFRRKRTV